jgi:hypothetical protein
MSKSLAIILATATVTMMSIAGQAFGAPRHDAALTKVTVAMHDPGCHWFSTGGKFTKTLSAKGPVELANFDEATLKIKSASGVRLDGVGKKIILARGSYRITMVGQARDDNTLKLIVE